MSISVLILTRNEENNLPACLASVQWSDDIVVLDSDSTDRTRDIAAASGARVVTRTFEGELERRTFSLRGLTFKHPWVYNPDADEQTPDDLRDEMLAVVRDPARNEVAYRVRFKNMFMGRWIKRSSLYPTWVMRLFRPDRIRLDRCVNLRYAADGPVGFLQAHFVHESFANGLDAWIAKHNDYSQQEAREARDALAEGPLEWRGLLAWRDSVRLRAALKQLSFRLPFRPTLRFLYTYFLRMGFLDGRAGLTYCRLLAWYEYMIVLKMNELRHHEEAQSA